MSEVLTHRKPIKHRLDQHIADVAISSPAGGEVLTYEAATALWKNKPGAAGLASQQVSGTTNASTSSTTFEDLAEMILAVATAGKYLLVFFINQNLAAGNVIRMDAYYRLMRNDVEVEQWLGGRSFLSNQVFCFPVTWVKTYDFAKDDVIHIEWRTDNSLNTITNPCGSYAYFKRTLLIVRIAD